MLTANHVNLSVGYVSFDGSTTFQIDAGFVIQDTYGTDAVDLKVFQLNAMPGRTPSHRFNQPMELWSFINERQALGSQWL